MSTVERSSLSLTTQPRISGVKSSSTRTPLVRSKHDSIINTMNNTNPTAPKSAIKSKVDSGLRRSTLATPLKAEESKPDIEALLAEAYRRGLEEGTKNRETPRKHSAEAPMSTKKLRLSNDLDVSGVCLDDSLMFDCEEAILDDSKRVINHEADMDDVDALLADIDAQSMVASPMKRTRGEMQDMPELLPQSPMMSLKMNMDNLPHNSMHSQTPYKQKSSVSALPITPGKHTGPVHMFKILVVGNAKCGKTSIIQRYAKDSFSEEYNTTIGADYSRKVVSMVDGSQVHLQLWDLAGQDRFVKLTRPYYRNARAAVVVFDIAREETFQAVRDWKREIDHQFGLESAARRAEFPVILLMNKCDLLDKSVNELLRMGQELERMKNECGFTAAFTTSAKECRYVNECMESVVNALFDMEKKNEQEDDIDALIKSSDDKTVDLNSLNEEQVQASCCY